MHFNIPNEIWLRIMSYLSMQDIIGMGATSQRYHQLSKDPSLWKSLVFNWKTIQGNLRGFHGIINRATKLEKLSITNNTEVDVDHKTIVSVIKRAKTTLKVLILDRDINSEENQDMEMDLGNHTIEKFRHLKKLEVLHFSAENLQSDGVIALGRLRNLTQLKMTGGCNEVMEEDLNYLFEELNNLVMVDLSECDQVMTDEVVEILARNNPNLERLVLDDCVKLQGFGFWAPIFKNLKHLSLSGCYNVTDAAIQKMANSCSHLESINLKGCVLVEDSGVKSLAQKCPNLQSINLEGCNINSENCLSLLWENCKKLQFVEGYFQ